MKRGRSIPKEGRIGEDHFPPLPPILGDKLLEVFTHKSLTQTGHIPTASFTDNARLSELGRTVLDCVITNALFSYEVASQAKLVEFKGILLSDAKLEGFVKHYDLIDKLRCNPDKRGNLNIEDSRTVFQAYVGALFAESGITAVEAWVGKLVDPRSLGEQSANLAIGSASELPSAKRIKESTDANQTVVPPDPPSNPALAAPRFTSMPNPLSPAQPYAAFLPLFKQAAQQRRVTLEFSSEFSGPSHAGYWTVTCIVNGIEKGKGTASNKQVAKEEAARQAYYSMGWAPYG